jgi:hypothetical protein
MLELISLYTHLTKAHTNHGPILDALDEWEKTIQKAVLTGDKEAEALGLIEYGKLIAQSQLADPIEYYQKALTIALESGDMVIEMALLEILGQNCIEKLDLESAETCFRMALDLAQKTRDAKYEERLAQTLGRMAYMKEFDNLSKGNL